MTYRYVRNAGEPVFDVAKRRHIDVSDWHDDADLSDVFTTIYRTNRWASHETRSGIGSERSRMTQVIAELGGLIRDLGVRTVLDVPWGISTGCGMSA